MTLTDGDKAIIKEIAREVLTEYRKDINREITLAVVQHRQDCPGSSVYTIWRTVATIGAVVAALASLAIAVVK